MKPTVQFAFYTFGLASLLAGSAQAAGPYSPTDWPPIDSSKKVHYSS